MRDPQSPYWNPERELRDPAERDAGSLAQLRRQLERVYAQVPFYRRHWDAHGFHPDHVRTFDDFTKRCPTVNKKQLVADQAEHPPFGSYLGVPREDVFRIHGSSGTSGTPTMYGITRRDWDHAREIFAITQWSMGVRPTDTVHFAFPFGLFFGGWGMLYAAECTGATTLPMGATTTQAHLAMIDRMQCTFIQATPSYLLHMADVAEQIGFDTRGSSVKRVLTGGEPGGSLPTTRAKIIEAWGLDSSCDSGTSSEMFPFCTSTECTEMNGMHLYNDEIWTELVDPQDSSRPVPEGEVGSVVYTHLWRESQPMIRFEVGDRSVLSSEPCPCGRTYPRLPQGLLGRADDMLVVRGANLYPSAVEHALRGVPGLGLEFRIRVFRKGTMDELEVSVEVAEGVGADRDALQRQAAEALHRHCMIRIPVTLIEANTYERATLKARRVIDERETT